MHTYLYLYIYIYTHMYICMYICIFIYIFIYIYMCIYIHTHIYTYTTYILIHAQIFTNHEAHMSVYLYGSGRQLEISMRIIHFHVSLSIFAHLHKGWLRLVGSIKLYVSFAKEPYKRDDILQKRPTI